MEPGNLNIIHRFIFEDVFSIDSETVEVETLWNDGAILDIKDLMEACVKHMVENVSARNWWKWLRFSGKENCEPVQTAVLNYVSEHYLDCLEDENFEKLNSAEVLTILRLPVRNDCSEETIFDRVAEWVKVDEWNRAQEAAGLLKELDLASLPKEFLRNRFEEERILRNIRCRKVYDEAMIRIERANAGQLNNRASRVSSGGHSGNGEETSQDAEQRTLEAVVSSSSIGLGTTSHANHFGSEEMAGNNHERPRKKRKYGETLRDVQDRSLSPVASPVLSSPPASMEVASDNEGQAECKVIIKVEPFTTADERKQIIYIRQGHFPRKLMATDLHSEPIEVAEYHGREFAEFLWVPPQRRLYALGGMVRHQCTKEVMYLERSSSTQWISARKMIDERTRFKPAVLGNHIYAIGGAEGCCKIEREWSVVNASEMLPLDAGAGGRWAVMEDYLNSVRELFAVAVMNGKIYVVGGCGSRVTDGEEDCDHRRESVPVNFVESYNPEERLWRDGAGMNRCHFKFSVTVLNSKLYALGGSGAEFEDQEKDCENMKSAEVYDPEFNTWTMIAPMLRPRRNGCAVALNGKIYAVGGDRSEPNKVLSSVEVYDPVVDEWTLFKESLDDDGIFASAAIIEDPNDFF